ncbi:MAG: LysM peptidoglycan-binding domain-containing protein, partial [Acidimicrobiia bacterium]|nr:LysM peptidoglycan-binding domain-containing protein [Acidimicrobiia bacterium]
AAMEVDTSLSSYDSTTETGRPPWVQFHWGDLHTFKAIISSLELTFTYFGADGTPLRAKASVSLKQFEPEGAFGPQNPTSGTPLPERTHQVQAGETLDRIAASYYGDPTRWRRIADANGISDPLAVPPGTLITIPKARD